AEDCLPISAAPPGPGHHQSCCKNEVVLEASCDGAFAAADCLSSALTNLQREDDSFYLPMYSAPPAVGDEYFSDLLAPDADGIDEALLMPFSDIDLQVFDSDDEHRPPVDQMVNMIPPAVLHHPSTAGTQNGGAVHAHQKAMAVIDDSCFRRGASGVEMAVVRHHGEPRQGSSSVAPVPPPSLPGTRARRSDGRSARAGKTTKLDYIGFDELRKYFCMPITRAAREMNVGLTVLKKRCRELGVARWPHRKMKSLKSLMANVQ
ncbi:hypothetical protein ACJX0J_035015, partial [Zea mays]